MQRNKLLNNIAIVTSIQFFITLTAFANTVNIDAAASGWLRDNGDTNNYTGSGNYIAGYTGSSDQLKYYNYFVFDLSGIESGITSATLRLENPDNGFYSLYNDYFGLNNEYNYYVTGLSSYASYLSSTTGWDYGTSIGAVSTIKYSTTDRYGEVSVNESSNGTMIEITLNQLAINDINALLSTGGSSLFALGGNLETVNTLENRVFGNTSYGSFTRALSVEYGNISTVPIPAAAWLFGSGLIGMIGVAKRKKV